MKRLKNILGIIILVVLINIIFKSLNDEKSFALNNTLKTINN